MSRIFILSAAAFAASPCAGQSLPPDIRTDEASCIAFTIQREANAFQAALARCRARYGWTDAQAEAAAALGVATGELLAAAQAVGEAGLDRAVLLGVYGSLTREQQATLGTPELYDQPAGRALIEALAERLNALRLTRPQWLAAARFLMQVGQVEMGRVRFLEASAARMAQ